MKLSISLITLMMFISILVNCNRELNIDSINFCDLWDNNGKCLEYWNHDSSKNSSKKQNIQSIIYYIPKEEMDSFLSWKELSHYLYFQAKETPGIIIHWNRNITDEERKIIQSSCKAYFRWNGLSGEMEGREIGKSYIGFFHYLGTMIEKEKKSASIWESKPELNFRIPNHLEIEMDCLGSKKTVQGQVLLQLK